MLGLVFFGAVKWKLFFALAINRHRTRKVKRTGLNFNDETTLRHSSRILLRKGNPQLVSVFLAEYNRPHLCHRRK